LQKRAQNEIAQGTGPGIADRLAVQVAHAGDRSGDLGEPENLGRVGRFGRDDPDWCALEPRGHDIDVTGSDGNVGLTGSQRLRERGRVRYRYDPHIEALMREETLFDAERGVGRVPRTAIRHRHSYGLDGSGKTGRRAKAS
jgi:hypothetical protein